MRVGQYREAVGVEVYYHLQVAADGTCVILQLQLN